MMNHKKAVEYNRFTYTFLGAFTKIKEAIHKEREAEWSLMTKETALLHANSVVNNITLETEQTIK